MEGFGGGGVVCCNTFINLPAGCSGQHNIRLGSVAPPRLEGKKKKKPCSVSVFTFQLFHLNSGFDLNVSSS